MSWLFSRALVAGFSAVTCSAGAPSAPLNTTTTPQAYCSPDRMTALSRLSRFGMTFEPLTADRGEELLMSFLEDSRAKTLAKQEVEKVLTASAQGYGGRWQGLSAKYHQGQYSLKTAQFSLVEDLTECYKTLPKSGLMLDGAVLELTIPALPTAEKDFGWWQTPTVEDAKRNGSVRAWELWLKTKKTTHCRLRNQAAHSNGKDGRVNPEWIEWLMGWPIGWTGLQPLEMAKFHEWQQQHGGC